MAAEHARPHHELAEEDGEGRGPGEGARVPIGPLHTAGGHTHSPHFLHPPDTDRPLNDDGDETADHDQGLEEVSPDHRFQATLKNKEMKNGNQSQSQSMD